MSPSTAAAAARFRTPARSASARARRRRRPRSTAMCSRGSPAAGASSVRAPPANTSASVRRPARAGPRPPARARRAQPLLDRDPLRSSRASDRRRRARARSPGRAATAPARPVQGSINRRSSVSAENSLNARLQLLRAERLLHVVVGAGLEATRDVGLLHASGQQDHGDRGRLRVRAELARHLVAGQLRHHHVQHRQVRLVLAEPQRLLAVAGRTTLYPARSRRNDTSWRMSSSSSATSTGRGHRSSSRLPRGWEWGAPQ